MCTATATSMRAAHGGQLDGVRVLSEHAPKGVLGVRRLLGGDAMHQEVQQALASAIHDNTLPALGPPACQAEFVWTVRAIDFTRERHGHDAVVKTCF